MYGDTPGEYRKFYGIVRNRHPFIGYSGFATGTIRWLKSRGFLVHDKGIIQITDLGKKKVDLFIEKFHV